MVMIYVRYPPSLRNVEYLLFERGTEICHETVRFWWNRFGPMFAADIRRQRFSRMRGFNHSNWHHDAMYVLGNREKQEIGRLGRAALPCDLKTALPCPNPAEQREVAIGLTVWVGKLGQQGRCSVKATFLLSTTL